MIKKKRHLKWLQSLVCLTVCLAASYASAVDTTWTGAVSTDVTDAANWDMGVPGMNDNAIVVTASNAPDLFGNSVTWGKLTLRSSTSIADSSGTGVINLADAGISLFSEGSAESSTIAPPIVATGKIQTNGDHSVTFNGDVTASKIETFATSVATYNGAVSFTDGFVTISGPADAPSIVINDQLNWNFGGEKGFNGGATLAFGPLSTVDLGGVFNLFDGGTVRTDGDNVITGATDLWDRHGDSTLDLNGFSQALEFIGTNGGINMNLDFGVSSGANSLIWDASFNTNGTYAVQILNKDSIRWNSDNSARAWASTTLRPWPRLRSTVPHTPPRTPAPGRRGGIRLTSGMAVNRRSTTFPSPPHLF